MIAVMGTFQWVEFAESDQRDGMRPVTRRHREPALLTRLGSEGHLLDGVVDRAHERQIEIALADQLLNRADCRPAVADAVRLPRTRRQLHDEVDVVCDVDSARDGAGLGRFVVRGRAESVNRACELERVAIDDR